MSAALKRRLKDFDAKPPAAADVTPGNQASFAAEPAAAAIRAAAPEPPVDLEAERAAAREAGYQAAVEALSGEHRDAIAALADEHATALAALKQRYEDEVATRIEQRFEALTSRLGEQIGWEAAAVVAPFVEHAVAERMVGVFGDALVKALGEEVVTLTVSGPVTLFERLSRAPALAGVALRHVETDEPDLSVAIGGSVLATRLGAFTERLAEALP